MVAFYSWDRKKHGWTTHFAAFGVCKLVQTQPDCKEFSTRRRLLPKHLNSLNSQHDQQKATENYTCCRNKPLIYQPKEAMGSPEKAGQCCHFQSDWHWAVSLHSTVHDSALVANTGSSVTAAVQSKIVWKHEWMIWFTKKVIAQSEWRPAGPRNGREVGGQMRQWDRQIGFWQTMKRNTTSLEWKRENKSAFWVTAGATTILPFPTVGVYVFTENKLQEDWQHSREM